MSKRNYRECLTGAIHLLDVGIYNQWRDTKAVTRGFVLFLSPIGCCCTGYKALAVIKAEVLYVSSSAKSDRRRRCRRQHEWYLKSRDLGGRNSAVEDRGGALAPLLLGYRIP